MTGYLRATSAEYRHLQETLLPRGRIWRRPGSALASLLDALGAEWARVHNRLLDVLEESDPRTADELLAEWLVALGLPTPCAALPSTTADKRRLAHAAFIASGGNTPAHIVAVAAALGLEVTVTEEQKPLRAGFRAGERCYSEAWAHVWTVVVPPESEGTLLLANLICLVQRQKPLHTRVLFAYAEE